MKPSMALARGAMVHLLLLLCRLEFVQSQSDNSSDAMCSTFSAHVLGSAGNETYQDTFNCSDGAYVTGVNITYGWWIDGLQIFCSTGNASDWYGDETLEGVIQAFVDTQGGLTSMTSQFRDHDGQHFPCFLTFLAYTGEVEGSASESEIGPYGSCGRSYSSTSPTSQWDTVSGEFNGTSDCGLDAYAIGFFMHYDDEFIYGLGLQCQTITAACPAPDGLEVPDTLVSTHEPYTPPPATESDDSSDAMCSTFSAHVLGSAGNETIQDTFNCSDGAYVTGVNITYGWWIDGLQIFCSTGNASDWYGDETLEGVIQAFVDTQGGLTSMTSQFRDHYGQHFPCFLTFLAYTSETEGSASESEIGPYGSCGRSYSSTSPTSQWDTVSGEFNGTSDCGLDAYAIGFFMHYDDEFIYGLGLQCRTITAACPAPDGLEVPDTLVSTHEPYTPPPATESDDSSDSTCSTFSAHVLGSAGNETFQDTFNCSDGAYVAGVNITYGWWIDGLQIFCSAGNASDWYGDETLEGVIQAFVDTQGGLTSMTSQFRDHYGQHFPCFLTFLAYTGEVEGSASESEIGPYGSCGRSYSSTSPTSQWDTVSGEFNGTSDCGLDAYAIGFFVHYDDEFIYGLGLQCRAITAACPAPDGLGETPSVSPTHQPSTLLPTHAPFTLLPTSAPTRETPAPVEPTVELGGDCSEFSCVEGLCCSEDHTCGATASFCRSGLCCKTQDESNCTAGTTQCIIDDDDVETQWYHTSDFIMVSTSVGVIVMVGGASYAVYRHFNRRGRDSSTSSPV